MSQASNNLAKNCWSFFWRVAISGGLLWWLFQNIDLKQLWATAKTADPFYLFCACFLFFAINVIIFLRWWIFIKAIEVKASFFQAFRYQCFGLFGNLFLPSAIGGDVIKAVGITRGMDKKEAALATILLDRLSGFAGIAILGVGAFFIGGSLVNDHTVLLMILFMMGAVLSLSLVLFNETIYSFCCRIFGPFPKFKKALMNMHYDIVLLKNKKKEGFVTIVISLLAQASLALVYWLTAKGFGADVSVIYFLIFSPIVCIVTMLPSIGGLGVREVGWVFLLAKVGVSENIAASMSLMSFMFVIVLGLIGGAIYVCTLSSGRIQYHSPDTTSGSAIA